MACSRRQGGQAFDRHEARNIPCFEQSAGYHHWKDTTLNCCWECEVHRDQCAQAPARETDRASEFELCTMSTSVRLGTRGITNKERSEIQGTTHRRRCETGTNDDQDRTGVADDTTEKEPPDTVERTPGCKGCRGESDHHFQSCRQHEPTDLAADRQESPSRSARRDSEEVEDGRGTEREKQSRSASSDDPKNDEPEMKVRRKDDEGRRRGFAQCFWKTSPHQDEEMEMASPSIGTTTTEMNSSSQTWRRE